LWGGVKMKVSNFSIQTGRAEGPRVTVTSSLYKW